MNSAIGPKLPLAIDKKNGFLSISNFSEEIKQNFKILLLTNPGERISLPNFGVGLRNYLFENVGSEEIEFLIEKKIYEQVKKYLPAVKIARIYVYESQDTENLLHVTIYFYMEAINFVDQLTLSFSQ